MESRIGRNSVGNPRWRWDTHAQEVNILLGQYGRGVQCHGHAVYLAVRVNSIVERFGLFPGMSFDLTANDRNDGRPWAFNGTD